MRNDEGAPGWRNLASRTKVWSHRIREPELTIESCRPHFARAGITRVANVTGLDRIGIPVVMVMRPNARSVAVSAGKGLTTEAAMASGIMEAMESYHAENIIASLFRGSASELRSRRPYDRLHLLPRYAAQAASPSQCVWIEAECLGQAYTRLVPFELISADFTEPRLPGFGEFLQSTNGLASGNCCEEALLHAICETIERDSLSLWQRCSSAQRSNSFVDLASVDDPDAVRVMDMLAASGFEIAAWDITSEVGVPAFHCVIVDRSQGTRHHGSGSGCHPSPGTALVRALTESVQVRLTYVSGARDDIDKIDYATGHQKEALHRLNAEIARGKSAARRSFHAQGGFHGHDIRDDLDWVVERLAAAGLNEVFYVDLSRPDIGIPVVKVVVPGLLGPESHPDELQTPRDTARLSALR